MKRVKKLELLIVCIVFGACNTGQEHRKFTESDIGIIPRPKELALGEGSFIFDGHTKFYAKDKEQQELSQLLVDKFKMAANWDLEIVSTPPSKNYVQFRTDASLSDEAYKLVVDNDVISITAKGHSGFLYGLETVRQMLPPEIESRTKIENGDWEIPDVVIDDSPRFKWRGLMLDVSRHFFGKEYVLKSIDRLAFLKMNVLHFHLVDDQGWRIEIKKYPKLTEVGAFRVDQEDRHWNDRPAPKMGEKATYGGFYTQEDIEEIVAYATARGITVVPEIEMPAHVMSAIAAYPELSCFETPTMVPSGGIWPITQIYCAGKETSFEFLQNVLDEVMALFPSKYIHIGGDEATKTNWEKCPYCQKRIREEGLKNVGELQSYFIKRMESYIGSKGRVLMGWDEILEGGLAPGATVMSWRGVQGGLEASEQGHDVVMTPGQYCYFNQYQGKPDNEPLAIGGYLPLHMVYEFDPVADGMTQAQADHVLGGQANLWSEYIPGDKLSEYMLFPRLAALSETLWSPKKSRDWTDFSRRINAMFDRFGIMGIDYSKSAFDVTADAQVAKDTGKVTVSLKTEFPSSDIRYVLDKPDIDSSATRYDGPIGLDRTTTITASLFKMNKPVGRPFMQTFDFHKAVGKKVTYKNKYNDSYQGAGESNMVNVLRGTKNFHDGQWQAWLVDDMDLTVDLGKSTDISKVTLGSMENQGSGIYYPIRVEVLLSDDGKSFTSTGTIKRDYKNNGYPELKEFTMSFKKRPARYIRVKAKNLGHPPHGGDAWLFVDEIVIE